MCLKYCHHCRRRHFPVAVDVIGMLVFNSQGLQGTDATVAALEVLDRVPHHCRIFCVAPIFRPYLHRPIPFLLSGVPLMAGSVRGQ